MKAFFKKHGPYFFFLFISSGFLFWFFFAQCRLDFWQRLQLPFQNTGDALVNLMLIQEMIDGTGFPFVGFGSQRLGAPFGQSFFDFPIPENFLLGLWWLLTRFSSNPFWVLNFYFLLTYFFSSLSFFLLCRSLRVDAILASAFALLYAFLPYHFIRNVGHVFLASYFFVPLMVWILLKFWKPVPPLFFLFEKTTRFTFFKNVFLLGVIASSGLYYSFFFCFLVLVASLSGAFYRNSKTHFLAGLSCIGWVIVFLLLNFAPTLWGRVQWGKNPKAISRSAVESELYGLKLMNLLVPPADHPFVGFRRLNKVYHPGTPIVEGFGEYIGVIAALGLFCLLFQLLFMNKRPNLLRRLSFIILFCFLYGTLGGLSSFFGNWISPSIRAPNRISILMATCSLLASALFLQRWHCIQASWKRWVIGFGILILGVWDQVPSGMVLGDAAVEEHRSDQVFFQKVEALLKPAATILQLPFVLFPESPMPYQMGHYDPLRGFLYTRLLRFSYGCVKGREASKTIEELSMSPLRLEEVRGVGYAAILVDRRGLADNGSEIEAHLNQQLGRGPAEVSPNGRFSLFAL